MTTITKERIEQYANDPRMFNVNDEIRQIARIALASLEAEPIGAFHIADQQVGGTSDYIKDGEWPIDNGVIDVYAVPPVQETGVYNDVFNIIGLLKKNEWAEHCTSTVLGSLLESEITRLVGKEQPASVVPPAIEPDYEVIKSILPTANPDEYACTIAADMWNACRAAMLQGAEPVSQTYELPQTQFEQVADLYALCWQSGEVVTYTPDPEKATIWLNNYSGTCVQEYVKLELLQEALSGNSPVIPGGWISCSERMPDNDESKPIAIFTGKCLGQGMFVATYDDDGFFDYWEGMEIIGVSHWMPLPAAPEPDQS